LNYAEQIAFLKSLCRPRVALGIKMDLSLSPELFGHELLVKGLFLWGRALTEESLLLSACGCDVILFNEFNPERVSCPEGYDLFQIRDLQEFPYLAAVRIHAEEET